MLRWATELGRVDILTEVSVLSQCQAAPREGHLEEVLHIFGFLKKVGKLTLWFDPSTPNWPTELESVRSEDFLEHCRDAEELMPPDAPPPLGKPVDLTAHVDASHAANKVTRRSHIGHILFVQRAPIIWCSKRTATVESSAFSSEFLAMKTRIEHLKALRHKLRMFGVPVDNPTKVHCDDKSVVTNCTKFESTLNKKHNSIARHLTRWAVAAKEVTIHWIHTKVNFVDAMTKFLPEAARQRLFGEWTC